MAAALPRRMWLGVGGVAIAVAVLLSANTIGLLPNAIRSRLTDFTQQAQVFDVRGAGHQRRQLCCAGTPGSLASRRRDDPLPSLDGRRLFQLRAGLFAVRVDELAHRARPRAQHYLNVAAELGMPGLLAYLFLWGAIFWQTRARIAASFGWERGLALGLLGAWTHLSVHHLFDNLYVNNTHLLIGALLGVLTVLNHQDL